MAKVKWRAAARRQPLMPFINCPPSQVIILCAAPNQFEGIVLHCFDSGSFPCLDEDVCPHCAKGHVARVVMYAPALVQDRESGQYTRGVFSIGGPYGVLSERDNRGHRLTVSRYKRRDGTYSTMSVEERLAIPEALQRQLNVGWFDVRPRLLLRYGLESESYAKDPPRTVAEAVEHAREEPPATIPFARPFAG